jgi:signal transduction histidine kinase
MELLHHGRPRFPVTRVVARRRRSSMRLPARRRWHVPHYRHAAARRELLPDLLARLLEIGEPSPFLLEVANGSRLLTRATAGEMTLWRAGGGQGGTRRRTAPKAASDRTLRSLHERRSVLETGRGRVSMLVPVRHAGRTLGTLRLEWRDRPSARRLDTLRRYLEHAGAGLARILAEVRLARQHRRYEALLDSLPDACLLILSADGSVIGLRGRLQQSAGLDPARWLGAPLAGADSRSGLVRLSRAALRQLVATARAQGKAEVETSLRSKERDIQVLLSLVDLGQGGEMACVLRDLTSAKSLELALVRRNEELTSAAERLREIDVLKNEFLSNVSHELRTPLTAIIAYSEALLLAPPDTSTQRQFLRVISEQGHKLQRLIAGLLDIAKLESLATELKLLPASLNDVVRSAIVTVQPLADKSRIALSADLAPQLPLVYLDELRAQQIVWNLLTNAVKFSPPESTVWVRTWLTDDAVWAAVRDEGPGIAPEHQELIFQKFVQLDGSTTRRHGGVGLGLDLVKHLVELHGGTVQVESVPGTGATFLFSIPIEKRRKARLGDLRKTAVPARGVA